MRLTTNIYGHKVTLTNDNPMRRWQGFDDGKLVAEYVTVPFRMALADVLFVVAADHEAGECGSLHGHIPGDIVIDNLPPEAWEDTEHSEDDR